MSTNSNIAFTEKREARSFISRYNSPLKTPDTTKGNTDPIICEALVAARRNFDDYFDFSIGPVWKDCIRGSDVLSYTLFSSLLQIQRNIQVGGKHGWLGTQILPVLIMVR
ncbi:hypothetical protein BDV29DRAFT_164152 [Aspergillus leporis]|uniref:Uncharacterized protein n=1 Tax=Aspergillus leporis TaxID=41062 RepID=A0A5N5XHE0_9EURO|nr:hypothetical protein BDV29DRAFT_164152 [Aspergillus leporis]